ncbi:MAG TPA: GNAT family N-acetyltransferase [Ktedonobacterales bacterium]
MDIRIGRSDFTSPLSLPAPGVAAIVSETRVDTLPLRAARPDDADDRERLMRLYGRLSPLTIYQRLFLPAPYGPEWAARFAALALRRQERATALLILTSDQTEIIAVGQYARDDARDGAGELALVVEDAWQGRGAGTRLLHALLRQMRADGYTALSCHTLAENRRAQHFLSTRLPHARKRFDSGVYEYVAPLDIELDSNSAAWIRCGDENPGDTTPTTAPARSRGQASS